MMSLQVNKEQAVNNENTKKKIHPRTRCKMFGGSDMIGGRTSVPGLKLFEPNCKGLKKPDEMG